MNITKNKKPTLHEWFYKSLEEYNNKKSEDFITFETHVIDLNLNLTKEQKSHLFDLYKASPRISGNQKERDSKVRTSINLLLELFRELIDLSIKKKIAHALMPMIALPLGLPEELVLWKENFSLIKEINEFQLPSLYLIDRELEKTMSKDESYKKIVEIDMISKKLKSIIDNLCVYYVCAPIPDWIGYYYRSITVEYYPPELIHYHCIIRET